MYDENMPAGVGNLPGESKEAERYSRWLDSLTDQDYEDLYTDFLADRGHEFIDWMHEHHRGFVATFAIQHKGWQDFLNQRGPNE